MNIKDSYLDALKELGYSETESRFLYIAGTHSGYFTAAQFRSFSRLPTGKRSFKFTQKVIANKHAALDVYAQNTRVYHVFSRKLYSAIGKENIRNRRQHEFSFIETRLTTLDYILANQGHDYFETEDQKVRYFCGALGLGKECLPTRLYLGQRSSSVTARYFVDKFPMFRSGAPSSTVVTFTYVAADAENLTGFVTHLHDYLPLFRQLKQFNFLFISARSDQFAQARQVFSQLVETPLSQPAGAELLRYFRIRKAWESKQFEGLKHEDVQFLHDATSTFRAERFQELFRAWNAGTVPESELRAMFPLQANTRKIGCDTYAVRPQGFLSRLTGVIG
jgi:hypothetical protein